MCSKEQQQSRGWWMTLVLCLRDILTCQLFTDKMGFLEDGLPAVGWGDSCPMMSQVTQVTQRALDLESAKLGFSLLLPV